MKRFSAVVIGMALHAAAPPGALAQVAFNFTTFDVPGGNSARGFGINDVGQIAGSYGVGNNISHGFMRGAAGSYTTIDFPGATETSLNKINAAGEIVGRYKTPTSTFQDRSFLRSSGGSFTPIEAPGAQTTLAFGINGAGQIVGYLEDASSNGHGFLRSPAGNFTTVDAPGATSGTYANDINSAGQIVGFYIDAGGGFVGFLRSPGGNYSTFSVLPGVIDTFPYGINDAGQIVGVYSGGSPHGFLLSGGTLTTIDVPGAIYTEALGINSLGQIVGDFADASGVHGFIATPIPEPGSLLFAASGIGGMWLARRRRIAAMARCNYGCLVGPFAASLFLALAPAANAQVVSYTFTTIDAPGAGYTEAYGINNAGFIVGHFSDATGDHGFLRHPNGTYTTYDVSGADQTVGFGINASGAIAGSYFGSPPAPQGFLRSPGGTITLLGPPDSVAQGINDAGKVVGIADSQGYIYTGGNFTAFSVPGATGTLPFGINNSDQIAGTWQTGTGEHGFVRSAAGGYTLFDVPGANNTGAFGINDAGEIVVIADDAGYLRLADGTFSVISYPGSTATLPFGINNLGQVVGSYLDSAGNGHSFLATPVPEPCTLLLCAAGALGLSGQVRRRSQRDTFTCAVGR